MGDFRFRLEMSVVGRDGKEHKRDWWLNWNPDISERVYREVIEMAEEADLDVDDRTYIFDE